jgi:lipoprotein-releasing system permease protein
MFQFDSSYVYVTLDEARRFLDEPDRINAIRVRVNDAEMAPVVRAEIAKNLSRQDLRVRDWNEMNRGLLSALKLERIAMFIVLSLATIVASFCILCTLLLMVTEKSREIAILKALGASDRGIISVFVVEGMIIGGIGTMIGVVAGYATFFGISWLKVPVPFSEDVFYLDKIPVNVNPWNFALITICALVICLLSTLYPAYTASKLLPVDGLRHE